MGPVSGTRDDELFFPDFVGEPVTGWRCWKMSAELVEGPVSRGGEVFVGQRPTIRLASVNQSVKWEPRVEFEAQCSLRKDPPHPDGVPDNGCQCGVHFLMGPLALARLGYTSFIGEGKKDYVWGTVNGWGRIIEGTTGHKAQFAYPKHLYVRKDAGFEVFSDEGRFELDHWKVAEVLSAAYGVPCDVISHVARPDENSEAIVLIPLERGLEAA